MQHVSMSCLAAFLRFAGESHVKPLAFGSISPPLLLIFGGKGQGVSQLLSKACWEAFAQDLQSDQT